MRIAFIGHKRIPSREGGVEIVVDELSARMSARGNRVVVYNRKGHNVAGAEFDDTVNASDKPFSYQGVHVVPVTTFDAKGMAALSSSFFATLKAIAAKPDVIHYHAEGPCVMLRLAHWAGIRTVATIHGLDWQRAKWGRFASTYLKFGERTAAKCADEVIVLSRNMQEYFKNTYGRDTRFIPNGIERKQLVTAQEITSEYGLHKDDYILFLGRIVPEKGVHYLIDAFGKLDTDKKLVIAGGSSDSTEYYEQDATVVRSGGGGRRAGFGGAGLCDDRLGHAARPAGRADGAGVFGGGQPRVEKPAGSDHHQRRTAAFRRRGGKIPRQHSVRSAPDGAAGAGHGSMRFTFGPQNTMEEAKYLCDVLEEVIPRRRAMSCMWLQGQNTARQFSLKGEN